jgi:hypothetical protein
MRTGISELERVDVTQHGADRRLTCALSSTGFALLDGIADADTLLTVARSIGAVVPHRDSRPDGVTVLEDRGADRAHVGFAGFGHHELVPHTDRSSVERPPGLLLMACGRTAEHGGECVAVDGAAVYQDLSENEPDALEALTAPRSALFGGAAGYLGAVFTPQPNALVAIRLRLDGLARFSPTAVQWLPALRSTIDRHLTVVPLRAGQGYALNNSRWLHGRRAFTGDRVLYRVTADPLPHLAIPTGFRPDRVPSDPLCA